jgi:hypothetical protein
MIAVDSICRRIAEADLYDKVELDARPQRRETAYS